jgi:2'-5' RNA ligase
MPSIRTFIAIETPGPIRKDILSLQDRLKRSGADVRWEPEDKFHATVKFLGDVDETALPGVLTKIETVVVQHRACEVIFEKLGCFPDNKRPRVVWVGCSNPDGKLEALKSMLDNELRVFGFEIESRPFRPHITLGRIKSQNRIEHLISILENLTFEPHASVVNKIFVMKSMLKPKGSEYSVLQTIQLNR